MPGLCVCVWATAKQGWTPGCGCTCQPLGLNHIAETQRTSVINANSWVLKIKCIHGSMWVSGHPLFGWLLMSIMLVHSAGSPGFEVL